MWSIHIMGCYSSIKRSKIETCCYRMNLQKHEAKMKQAIQRTHITDSLIQNVQNEQTHRGKKVD